MSQSLQSFRKQRLTHLYVLLVPPEHYCPSTFAMLKLIPPSIKSSPNNSYKKNKMKCQFFSLDCSGKARISTYVGLKTDRQNTKMLPTKVEHKYVVELNLDSSINHIPKRIKHVNPCTIDRQQSYCGTKLQDVSYMPPGSNH